MTSGAMASNGELYALDMGNPVKILDLAENMVRLSGLESYKDIQIIEALWKKLVTIPNGASKHKVSGGFRNDMS